MNYNELDKKLKEITIEDYIWVIYVGIIITSWYANNLERNYFINNDILSKEKYHHIMIIIFSILLIVYLYFFKSSLDDAASIKNTNNIKKIKLTELSSIASLLILLSGIIFLYIASVDDNLDVEVAFN